MITHLIHPFKPFPKARSIITVAGICSAVLMLFFVSLAPQGRAEAAVTDWQRSISIYPMNSNDFTGSNFNQMVTHMKSLGFNYVTLIIPQYQSNVSSSDIGPSSNTPSDAALISAIQYVHSQGMGVILKPHLDPGDGQWRAYINPSNRTTWFANYQSLLLRYASIAKQYGVEEFCIGAELISVSSNTTNPDNTTEWQGMIAAVRGTYGGKILYDANWGGDSFSDEVSQVNFWGSVDYIGISAYYNLLGDGSISSLNSDWDGINASIIRPLSLKYGGKPIVFSEIGYRSYAGAHLQPWNASSAGGYSAQEQVNDYAALISYWNDYSYMQGVGLWYAATDPNWGGSNNTDYLIMNKPVEQTFQQYFIPANKGSGSSTGAPAAFTASGAAQIAGTSGAPMNLAVSVTDTGTNVSNTNVDMEVYDQNGTKVFQKVFSGQNFSSGQQQQYASSWTPNGSGSYVLKLGVFSADWGTLYIWNNQVSMISVARASSGTPSSTGSASTTPTTGGGTTNGSVVEDIWWPGSGVTVSGVQPFKAIIENMALSHYAMYWQVDGGQLNAMQDSQQDYPHKESLVDLSGWNWRGSGPYTVNFVAKDGNGAVISQKSVQITISH